MGGIRSTGLSSCLGIAKHVASFLPSLGFQTSDTTLTPAGMLATAADHNWTVTHPITKFGILGKDSFSKKGPLK